MPMTGAQAQIAKRLEELTLANEYDMSWEDVGVTTSAQFFKIESGRQGNRVRIVSKPAKLLTHWEQDVENRNKKIICPGSECPLCKAGAKPSVRYAVLVLDKCKWSPQDGYGDEGPKVKLMEVGITVVRAIREYATSSLYGDPTKYDLIIKKEGTGRETKYSVVPDPNKSDLTPEEREVVESMPTIHDIQPENTPEEIMNMNLLTLGATPSDLASDVSTAGGAPAATTQKSNGNASTADGDWNMF